jgi:uncharacterized repeat protein (TIGR03803 family)
LIADRAGNFYGTTVGGGASYGGVMFKLSPSGTETVLLSGTTRGGTASGGGVVLKLSPGVTETALYSFTGRQRRG